MISFFYRLIIVVLLITNSNFVLARNDTSLSFYSPNTSSKTIPSTRWQVNINNASATELAQKLKGVGASKAAAIIAYREEHGGFNSVEDLLHVKGIGEKLLERNRGKIVLE